MLLVVDVGNTQTHLGTYDGGDLVEHWPFATVRESTADEIGAALRSLLALRGVDVRRSRRVDRVRHGAVVAPGVDGDGDALPGARDAARRAGAEDGDGDPVRQPARDRAGPARRRRRRLRSRRTARA